MQKVYRILMLLAVLFAAGSPGRAQSLAPIFPVAASPQLPGADFDVEVKIGNGVNPVSNLFGVSFELNYTNTTFVDVVGAPVQGDFLGNDIIFFPNVEDANGKVSVGMSRKSGQSGVNGNGTVLKVKFKTLATTPGGTLIQFTLTNVTANDPNGAPINLNPQSLTVTINQPLPVELVDFRANAAGADIELTWHTASETNNYGFEIQRRGATGEFQRAGFVVGHGTTTEAQNYRFLDSKLASGSYYYRLKQIDTDGSFTYSAVVEAIARLAPETFVLQQNHPNPFNPVTTVEFVVGRTQPVHLSVYNVLGHEVATLFHGTAEAGKPYRFLFNGTEHASGVYLYRLQSSDRTQIRKMLMSQ